MKEYLGHKIDNKNVRPIQFLILVKVKDKTDSIFHRANFHEAKHQLKILHYKQTKNKYPQPRQYLKAAYKVL